MTTIRANLSKNAITQYQGFNFNSFCMFQGKPLACGPDGIFLLEDGKKDVYTTTTDERKIPAWFELPISSLGSDEIKKGRRLYITGEMDGDMKVTATANENEEVVEVYPIAPRNKRNVQHTVQVPLSYKQKGEHWSFVFENVKGSDFSIDSVDGVFIPVTRRLGL